MKTPTLPLEAGDTAELIDDTHGLRIVIWDTTGRETQITLPGGDEGAAILRPLTTALAQWLHGQGWTKEAVTTTTTTEDMAGIDRAEVRRVLENEFWPFLAHDPHDPERFWGLAVDAVMGLLATARTRPTRQQLIHVLRENDPDNYGGHNTAAWYYEAQADAVLALLAEPQGWTEEAGAA